MKVGLFSPYLDTLGGGERYLLTIAEYLVEKDNQVDIFWDDETIKNEVKKRFAIDLSKIRFKENIFSSKKNLFQRWQLTRRYDLIIYLSDGSLPFLFAKKNLIHFQVPFTNVAGKSPLNQFKIGFINEFFCNSCFTKKYIDKEFNVQSRVLYPPVAVNDFKEVGKKENIILSVGRFTKTLHAKKQDILVEVFKKMVTGGLKQWKLILAGGATKTDQNYIDYLNKVSSGYPIEILTNINFSQIKNCYQKAKIFWLATGYNENEIEHPERMEHFGMVVVEAMASGCVSVVINKGGIPEIVKDGVNGFLWSTISELEKNTIRLIESPNLLEKIALIASRDSQKFSKQVFCRKIDELIRKI